VKTKRSITQKLSLMLIAVAALISFVSMPVFADTSKTQSAQDSAKADLCQGDSTQCVCPSTGPQAGQCGTNARTGCTADTKNTTIKCSDPEFKDCGKLYGKKSQEYKDCQANNNLFTRYINPFIKFLNFAVGLAVTIGILVGALQYISSAGDPQKAAKGKQHIWNAILALLVYLFLFGILNFLIPGGLV
jgi:hypothetical protein